MTETARSALSLGWGVQSWTLAAMAALGELPAPEVIVHADTTHEGAGTYAFRAKWEPWLTRHGMRMETVVDPTTSSVFQPDQKPGVVIPAFIAGGGMLSRQCTEKWKIRPIRRWLRANGFDKVEMWLGVSLDEVQRAKPSDVRWLTNRWPLLEKRMTRAQCISWLEARDLDVPPKSSCVFCPYKSAASWRALEAPDQVRAVAVDEAIRHARAAGGMPALFVHRAARPLCDVIADHALQPGLFEAEMDECTGHCFV